MTKPTSLQPQDIEAELLEYQKKFDMDEYGHVSENGLYLIGEARKMLQRVEAKLVAETIAADRATQRKRLAAELVEVIGDEEEPRFGPGEATYGDTHHDHNAVIYGRNDLRRAITNVLTPKERKEQAE